MGTYYSQFSIPGKKSAVEGTKTTQVPAVLSSVKNEVVSSQVELARRMAERQMAMQVASVRELLVWFVPFVVSSYGFLYYGYRKTNSWVVLFPLIPITFGFGYQLHYAYGNKTNQIKATPAAKDTAERRSSIKKTVFLHLAGSKKHSFQ